MIVINLQSYGDFDMPYTEALLIAPEGMSKSSVTTIVTSIKNNMVNSRDADKAIKDLKDHGFRVASAMNLPIGGNL